MSSRNWVYATALLFVVVGLLLVVFRAPDLGALLCSIAILILVVAMSSGTPDKVVVVKKPVAQTNNMNSRVQVGQYRGVPTGAHGGDVAYQPGVNKNTWTPQVHRPEAIAEVPNNAYLGYYVPPVQPLHFEQDSGSVPLSASVEKETDESWERRRQQVRLHNQQALLPPGSCGGVQPSGPTTIRGMPPMPGVMQYPGESIWRLPEYPVEQPSREGTIANIVPGLPTTCQTTPMQEIRNNGLYGIRGNLSCDHLKRSAVSDFGFLQPLGARDAWIAYNSYDQLHAKDQYLIPSTPAPAIHHRQYDPLLGAQ
jgi:hypothetical protein